MANFWRIWGSLIQRVLGIVGSQASLLALAFVFAPQPLKLEGWPAVVAAICSIVTLIAVYFEISSEKRPRQLRHVFALSDKERIKIYMRDWIRQAGRVAIWTRDMSWAHDAETMGLLATKAADHSLILCMPELIPAAQALKELGADTYITAPALWHPPHRDLRLPILAMAVRASPLEKPMVIYMSSRSWIQATLHMHWPAIWFNWPGG